jgi:hypothetical protein
LWRIIGDCLSSRGLWRTRYELAENTRPGMRFIQQFKAWPGGKTHADSVLNSLGDQLYSCMGWGIAYYFTKLFA